MADQDPMVELSCDGVFGDILDLGGDGHDVLRYPLPAHLGKGVVDEPRIQTSHNRSWKTAATQHS